MQSDDLAPPTPSQPEPSQPGLGAGTPAPKRPFLSAAEVAWPLAIFAGFGGTWLGLQVRLPGLAAAVAVALFVPLYTPVLARGRRHFVVLLAAGWAVGIAAAVIGTGLESETDPTYWSMRLPGARSFFATDLPAPFGVGGAADAFFSFARVRDLVALALVVLLARPLLGVFGLLVIALAQGAIAAGVLQVVLIARDLGEPPLLMAIQGWPPHLGLMVAAGVTLFVAMAEPGPLWPLRYAFEARRRLLWIGLGLAVLGAVGGLLFAPTWAEAVGEWLGQDR